jgi:DNA-binding transcriptional LysR family regulator
MPVVGTPSLDQLQVLITVVHEGSFAAAGRRLHRATSAISYSIASLEEQLGLKLFDRTNARRPRLTNAGEAVLAKARSVTTGVSDIKARVASIRQGLEAELTLVVDVMFPTQRLVEAVQAFEVKFPTVTLRLNLEALGAVSQLVRRGAVQLGIGGLHHSDTAGLEVVSLGQVEMIPVAAPSHSLAGPEGEVVGAARLHRQLVLMVREAFQQGPDVAVFASENWTMSDLGAKHALLLAGLGWGYMPEPTVRQDIAKGRLVRLKVPESLGGFYLFLAMYRPDTPPGPAGAWLIQKLLEQT